MRELLFLPKTSFGTKPRRWNNQWGLIYAAIAYVPPGEKPVLKLKLADEIIPGELIYLSDLRLWGNGFEINISNGFNSMGV